MKGSRYELWWEGKGDGVGDEGAMVEEQCEVRRVSEIK